MSSVEILPEKPAELTLICAWCGCRLRPEKDVENRSAEVSHGICPECRDRVLGQFREEVRKLHP